MSKYDVLSLCYNVKRGIEFDFWVFEFLFFSA